MHVVARMLASFSATETHWVALGREQTRLDLALFGLNCLKLSWKKSAGAGLQNLEASEEVTRHQIGRCCDLGLGQLSGLLCAEAQDGWAAGQGMSPLWLEWLFQCPRAP